MTVITVQLLYLALNDGQSCDHLKGRYPHQLTRTELTRLDMQRLARRMWTMPIFGLSLMAEITIRFMTTEMTASSVVTVVRFRPPDLCRHTHSAALDIFII